MKKLDCINKMLLVAGEPILADLQSVPKNALEAIALLNTVFAAFMTETKWAFEASKYEELPDLARSYVALECESQYAEIRNRAPGRLALGKLARLRMDLEREYEVREITSLRDENWAE